MKASWECDRRRSHSMDTTARAVLSKLRRAENFFGAVQTFEAENNLAEIGVPVGSDRWRWLFIEAVSF